MLSFRLEEGKVLTSFQFLLGCFEADYDLVIGSRYVNFNSFWDASFECANVSLPMFKVNFNSFWDASEKQYDALAYRARKFQFLLGCFS